MNGKNIGRPFPVVKLILFRDLEESPLAIKTNELTACLQTRDGHPFAVANVHLPAKPGSEEQQSEAITKLLGAMQNSDCNSWIVAGDFNIKMDEPNRVTEALRQSFCQINAGMTYFDPHALMINDMPLVPQAIDALLYSPDMFAPAAVWADYDFADRGLPSEENPSDHVPLCAAFLFLQDPA